MAAPDRWMPIAGTQLPTLIWKSHKATWAGCEHSLSPPHLKCGHYLIMGSVPAFYQKPNQDRHGNRAPDSLQMEALEQPQARATRLLYLPNSQLLSTENRMLPTECSGGL